MLLNHVIEHRSFYDDLTKISNEKGLNQTLKHGFTSMDENTIFVVNK